MEKIERRPGFVDLLSSEEDQLRYKTSFFCSQLSHIFIHVIFRHQVVITPALEIA